LIFVSSFDNKTSKFDVSGHDNSGQIVLLENSRGPILERQYFLSRKILIWAAPQLKNIPW